MAKSKRQGRPPMVPKAGISGKNKYGCGGRLKKKRS